MEGATLTEAQLARHQHTYGTTPVSNGYSIDPISLNNFAVNEGKGWGTSSVGNSKSHNHSFTGSSNNANNLPLYFALSYIMRTA